jgi:hypothetical protein
VDAYPASDKPLIPALLRRRDYAERLRAYRGIIDEAVLLNVGENQSAVFAVKRLL